MGMTDAQRKEFIEKFIWKDVPDDVKRMAWLLCEEYGLRPELKHLSLLWSKKRQCYTPYITRDGLIWIANNSGIKWGIEFGEPVIRTNPYNEEREDVYLPCKLVREDYPEIAYGIWFSEYNTKQNVWLTNPGTMHMKIGTVYGLRIGFNVCIASLDENERDFGDVPPRDGDLQQRGESEGGAPGGPRQTDEELEAKERKQLYDLAVEIGGEDRVKEWARARELHNLRDCNPDTLAKLIADMRRAVGSAPAPATDPNREPAPGPKSEESNKPRRQSSLW